MKKILTILFSLFTITSFAQDTIIYNKLKNDGYTFGGKDTVIKYALAYAVNNYFTGYGTWGSLPDTVRSFFSVDTSGSSGGSTYNPSTGVFHIPSYAGGGGSSTTMQQDSSLLIASTVGYINTLMAPYAGRKGLILRNTNTAPSASPAILFQSYNGGRNFWRVYNTGTDLYFDYSSDTASWSNALRLSSFSNIGSSYTPDLHVTLTSGAVTGTSFLISNAGYGYFGGTGRPTSVAWAFNPKSSATYGISFPQVTTTNRNNYPTGLLGTSGVISNAGSGYTNGSYYGKSFTNISGSGTDGVVSITVAGGVVTSVFCSNGTGYKAGDVVTVDAATIGGTGSGFTYTLTKTVGDQNDGTLVYDSTLHKMVYWSTGSHANMVLIDSTTISGNLTQSSASTLNLVAGNDYVFTGTTATYTLPAISSVAIGRQNRIYIKNRGSGTITLNAASGSTIYSTSAVTTINIIAGAACELLPDGTYFNVMYNQ